MKTIIYNLIAMLVAVVSWVSCDKPSQQTIEPWVDLGLPSGLLWASCNVGATSPELIGDFFAWGEVTPKSEYNYATYQWGETSHALSKYNTTSVHGTVDNLTLLDPTDDAATVNLGEPARMPTRNEWNELMTYTIKSWTSRNGIPDLLLKGTSGNSIFLPAAGCINDTSHISAQTIGFYWSSSLNSASPRGAWYFYFTFGDQGIYDYNGRDYGMLVRAVRSPDVQQ